MLNELPTTIHGYEFVQLIGRGGFSMVYLVHDQNFQQDFVAKVTVIDAELPENHFSVYDTEIEALKQLDHPYIIRLYDYFTERNSAFMILEYCPNGSLQTEIRKWKKLPFHTFINYGRQLVSALTYCHDHKIAHLDIKPGNVLLDSLGRTKLADFGISIKMNRSGLSNAYNGSTHYQAPEMFLKKVHDPFKADIWSLGVLFYTMVVGKSPWHCDTYGELRKVVCQAKYRMPSTVPRHFADLISRMLVADPDQRLSLAEISNHPVFQIQEVPTLPTASSFIIPDAKAVRRPRYFSNTSSELLRECHSFLDNSAENKSGREVKSANQLPPLPKAVKTLDFLRTVQPARVRTRYHSNASRQMTFLAEVIQG